MKMKCIGIMGSIFGHKFVRLVTYGQPNISMEELAGALIMPGDEIKAIKAFRPEFYHGCICKRCGAVTGEKK